MKPVIIIPALNPDDRLASLTKALVRLYGLQVVVVDDGSGEAHAPVFAGLERLGGCEVLRHRSNLGKGAALKTAMHHVLETYPDRGCVTADADLQHTPKDIVRVAEAHMENPDSLVLGARRFSGAEVPRKSRWGNRVTAALFRFGTGVRCSDTQTGLRAFPRSWMEKAVMIPGRRYEYEMNMLFEAAGNLPFVEVPIATIYWDGNRASHYRPLRDTLRITRSFWKFGCASLLSAAVDLALFTLASRLVFGVGAAGVMASTVAARLVSGGVNFTLNRGWVFGSRGAAAGKAVKYGLLFVVVMLTSGWLTPLLAGLGLHLTAAKILVDACLFLVSFAVQRTHIFRDRPPVEGERPGVVQRP